jgi:DNA polymerase zeta
MIANVTYGYTAAGFSGRMPCADLADAIVSTGRSTLQRAVALVEGRPERGARVVYGAWGGCYQGFIFPAR